jgi:hypothetical protein
MVEKNTVKYGENPATYNSNYAGYHIQACIRMGQQLYQNRTFYLIPQVIGPDNQVYIFRHIFHGLISFILNIITS